VDHAAAVRVGEGLAHLLEDTQQARQLVRGPGPLLEQFRQGAALDQLHGEVRPAIGQHADLVHGRDAGVLQLPGELRLLAEAQFESGVSPGVCTQHLDGHGAIQVRVAGAQHRPHAASGDLPLDLVPPRPPDRGPPGAGRPRGRRPLPGVGEPLAGRLARRPQVRGGRAFESGRGRRMRFPGPGRGERGEGFLHKGALVGQAQAVLLRGGPLAPPDPELQLQRQQPAQQGRPVRRLNLLQEILQAGPAPGAPVRLEAVAHRVEPRRQPGRQRLVAANERVHERQPSSRGGVPGRGKDHPHGAAGPAKGRPVGDRPADDIRPSPTGEPGNQGDSTAARRGRQRLSGRRGRRPFKGGATRCRWLAAIPPGGRVGSRAGGGFVARGAQGRAHFFRTSCRSTYCRMPPCW
jgi:hypothetical protein